MIIKICGVSTVEHALAAADAGADMLGLVFAPSRRQIDVGQASTITTALQRRAGPRPKMIGLFVNTPVVAINVIVDAVGLDLVQLSGDETLEQAAGLARPPIKAIRMDGSPSEAIWLGAGGRLLVDAHVAGAYGGTGVRADWARAADLARQVPFLMLAGGLDPTNVAAAIAQVHPWGVDVSSGVEEGGLKSVAKIRAFIAAARGAF